MIAIETGSTDPLPVETTAMVSGGSVVIIVPPEKLKHCNLDQLKQENGPDTVTVRILDEESKHGAYYSIWNPDQQAGEQQ